MMRHPDSTPPLHREFLDRAVPLLARDHRIIGVAATGSYAENTMDAFSDVDLVVACEPDDHQSLMQDRRSLAETLGPLVAAFTGEHVGEPRVMICLYGPPALHVDIKVVVLGDLANRVDDPVILWERDGRMTPACAAGMGAYPEPDAQWIEDRFWVWVHYAALKIGRGELQETFDFLSYLRVTVLGPLGLMRGGRKPAGVRRVEADPALARQLASTLGALNRHTLADALNNAVSLYRELRFSSVKFNLDAERVAMDFLRDVRANS
jgi:predicted nucleotidyltransferase